MKLIDFSKFAVNLNEDDLTQIDEKIRLIAKLSKPLQVQRVQKELKACQQMLFYYKAKHKISC